MNKTLLSCALTAATVLSCGSASAARLVLLNGDAGTGTGLDDATPKAPQGLNPGTTLGEQRRIVYQFAMDMWGAVLQSNVPIKVAASFQPLTCTSTQAVLGSAGANWIDRDFPNAPLAGLWYNSALADSLAGSDLDPVVDDPVDIVSHFNGDLGKPACLAGVEWYYGLDGKTPANSINFLNVVTHEIGHGLGFQGYINKSTGTFGNFDGTGPRSDAYTQNVYDNVVNLGFNDPAMTSAQRALAMRTPGRLVWTGGHVTTEAALVLNRRQTFTVSAPAAIAGNYLFGLASFGPLPTPANFNGAVVLGIDPSDGVGASTTDACSPFSNASDLVGKIVLVDRGSCTFVVKAANVQNAGGTAMVVADNAAGSPPPDLGGTDSTITIPAIRITLDAGNAFKANLPVTAGFVVSPTLLQGADDGGRVRLYAPTVVASGSTLSHYDTELTPNAIMEPFDTPTEQAQVNIDLTPALLRDTGWRVNSGNAIINNCDTTVDVVADGGLVLGANVQSWNDICSTTTLGKSAYTQCMDAYKTRALASGILVGNQGGKVLSCAAKRK